MTILTPHNFTNALLFMSILVCTSARAGDLMHPEGTSPDEALQLKEIELHLLPNEGEGV
jgi:hypothetical protein